MEPAQGPVTKIYMGVFPVVEVKLGAITINIGHQVHITIHLGDLPHNVKTGDRLPLFTEIGHAIPSQTSIQ
jgi:hypothetical protein